MAKQFEQTIRIKISLICLTILGTGGIFLYYIYHTGANSEQQLQTNLRLEQRLSLTSELIQRVNQAQSTANRIVYSRSRKELTNYQLQVDSIGQLSDSLIHNHLTKNDSLLLSMRGLLNEQQQLLVRTLRQPQKENPVKAITKQLEEIAPAKPAFAEDSVRVMTQTLRQDTLVSKKPKKGFFKRLAAAFAPDKDSLITVINHQTDTLVVLKPDSISGLSAIDSVARKASVDYEKQIYQLEKASARWIASNQQLTEQISALLLSLHREALAASREMIRQNEQTFRTTYTDSIIGGCIALTLILLLILLILLDISQAKKGRKALEAANAQNIQLMNSRHQLLLSVSHDMKTPLNTLLGRLELNQAPSEAQPVLLHAAKYMQSLLENLLDYSGLESGALQCAAERFDAYRLFMEICELFMPVAAQKQLAFRPDYAAEQPLYLIGDAVRIKQIGINLLSNAFKYTSTGSVGFHLSYAEQTLTLEVTDSGIGIPEAEQKRIFTPFTRLDAGRQMADGHGFGMSVVRGLTDLMQGKIELYSASGKGTRFRVTLPLRKSTLPPPTGRKRIAVIDDDGAFRQVICDMLQKLGHAPTGFQTPPEQWDADLILTDWEMPPFSGADVLKHAGETPVWVMSGKSDFSAEQARQLGFEGLIRKPFSLEALREIVGEGHPASTPLFSEEDAFFKEIIQVFIKQTKNDLSALEQALQEDDLPKAAQICHKMSAMFGQLGYQDVTVLLRQIDQSKGIPFAGWQAVVQTIIQEATQILSTLD